MMSTTAPPPGADLSLQPFKMEPLKTCLLHAGDKTSALASGSTRRRPCKTIRSATKQLLEQGGKASNAKQQWK